MARLFRFTHNLSHSLDPHSVRSSTRKARLRVSPHLGSILLTRYKRQRAKHVRVWLGRFVRVRRIELPTTGWKPVILPLNYTRCVCVCLSIPNRDGISTKQNVTKCLNLSRESSSKSLITTSFYCHMNGTVRLIIRSFTIFLATFINTGRL